MRRPYQITGIVLVLFAAFVARESLRLQFYMPMGPGPGFFPLLVSILVALLGATMFIEVTFREAVPMPADFFATSTGYLRIGAIVLGFLAVLVLMKPLGFSVTMLIFLVFLLLTLGRQSLLITAVVAVAGSFGTYYVFVKWLAIPLPTGIFGF